MWLLLLHLQHASGLASGCTTIVAGAKTTVDGSPIVTHSADSPNGDFRVVYVPAKDYAPGTMRRIFRADGTFSMYPRSTDSERSAQYAPVDGPVHEQEIIGHIPEVEHTHALWEGMYSLMNEHGLALGESTCTGKMVNIGRPDGGSALFTVATLMSVALERCTTAICAVETMGQLAEKYGFYGEDAGIDGAGEAVTAADADGHAWVFHITGGVNGTGAMWAAQRVPEGHVAVVANSFTIKEVYLDDEANFRGSTDLYAQAKASGMWDGKAHFNWQAAFAPDFDTKFEAGLNSYDPLRMWRVFHLANSELSLKPSDKLADMPFSVAPDKKVSNLMVMNWHRDTYDGTEFDMTLGALAGPWQSPRRHGGSAKVPGQYARSISMHWTLYCWLAQPAVKHPVLWFAPDSAKSTVFVPFYAEVLKGDGRYSQKDYGVGSQLSFSLTGSAPRPAWWAFNFVANWLEISYFNMSQTYVFPKVEQLQHEVLLSAKRGEAMADRASASDVAGHLADLHTSIQEHVANEWWSLAEMLIVRYNDQYFNFPPYAPMKSIDIGYPAFWFEMAGFNKQSYYPGWMQPSKEAPSLLLEPDLTIARQSLELASACDAMGADGDNCGFRSSLASTLSGSRRSLGDLAVFVLFGSACAAIGFWAGSVRAQRASFSVQDGRHSRLLLG